jgi:hypothetical protein
VAFFTGLDLGQMQDFSAVAVLDRVGAPASKASFTLRYLHRWTLGTRYPAIVGQVSELLRRPPLPRSTLVVDQTGVGACVVDLFRQAALPVLLRPLLITGGNAVTTDEHGVWHVPKRELVSVLQLLLQSGRLKIPANIPGQEALVKELLAFRVKITTAGNESFEAWRERDHDDLVLAVALAAWVGVKVPDPRPPAAGKAPASAAWRYRPRDLIPGSGDY